MVKRKGLPGRTPNTFAPLIRGAGDGFGVRMTALAFDAASAEFVDWAKAPAVVNVKASASAGARRMAFMMVRGFWVTQLRSDGRPDRVHRSLSRKTVRE